VDARVRGAGQRTGRGWGGASLPELQQSALSAWGCRGYSGRVSSRSGGAVAQLGERIPRTDEAGGSIPLCSTIPRFARHGKPLSGLGRQFDSTWEPFLLLKERGMILRTSGTKGQAVLASLVMASYSSGQGGSLDSTWGPSLLLKERGMILRTSGTKGQGVLASLVMRSRATNGSSWQTIQRTRNAALWGHPAEHDFLCGEWGGHFGVGRWMLGIGRSRRP
jgi:hypothetical protein